MQSVGEIETRAQARQRLLQVQPVFDAEAGVIQELFKHLQHRLHRKAVLAAQHPLQLQGHGLGQKQLLAGFDQLAGHAGHRAGAGGIHGRTQAGMAR